MSDASHVCEEFQLSRREREGSFSDTATFVNKPRKRGRKERGKKAGRRGGEADLDPFVADVKLRSLSRPNRDSRGRKESYPHHIRFSR